MHALFSKSKKDTKKVAPSAERSAAPRLSLRKVVLLRPRITEKATVLAEGGAYTFDIAPGATKREVVDAVRATYSVTPRLVRIVNIPKKATRSARTGKRGMKGGGRKAYVYLKKGESITVS